MIGGSKAHRRTRESPAGGKDLGSFPSQKVRKVIVALPEDAFSTILDARSFLCADFLSDRRRKERSFSRPSGGTEKTCFWVGEEKKGPSTCKISSSYSGKRWHRLFSRPFSREVFGKGALDLQNLIVVLGKAVAPTSCARDSRQPSRCWHSIAGQEAIVWQCRRRQS